MVIACLLLSTIAAHAQNPIQKMTPSSAATVTSGHKQTLRDSTDPQIGVIVNEPVAGQRTRTAPITIGVGGLVGFGEKDSPASESALDIENTSGPARIR